MTDEALIEAFWDSHPCGEGMVGGLSARQVEEYRAFFNRYDALKYSLERHIPACIESLSLAGRRVLEVGLGQGAEAELIIRSGANWSGLDLTAESVSRVKTRLAIHKLQGDVRQGSVLEIPWPDNTFDVVFSHGVLHHVPDITRAQHEIRRVLKPEGEAVVMLYARRSLNYQVSIRILRRLGLVLGYVARNLGYRPGGVLAVHLANAREVGLRTYMRMDRFLSANTDGPSNPFSRVYDVESVRKVFTDFEFVGSHKHFMHAPPLPVHRMPGGNVFGWHLWVHLRPR